MNRLLSLSRRPSSLIGLMTDSPTAPGKLSLLSLISFSDASWAEAAAKAETTRTLTSHWKYFRYQFVIKMSRSTDQFLVLTSSKT